MVLWDLARLESHWSYNATVFIHLGLKSVPTEVGVKVKPKEFSRYLRL